MLHWPFLATLLLAVFSPVAVWGAMAQDGLIPRELSVSVRGQERTVTLWVAEGFTVDMFASGVTSARMMAESPTGEFVVTTGWGGDVFKVADRDGDGRAEDVTRIFSGMNVPHGVAFAGDALFLAETDRILRLDRWWDPSSAREIARLPGGKHHVTRSLAIGPDNRLYVSIGSTCDVCVERDPMRAAIWRFELDGSGATPVARGLRNAVGLAFEPASGALWVTENERNGLGEDIPPDELNVVRSGGDYGWPACWGQRVVAPTFGSPERCAGTEPPMVELPAHSAPLGLAFAPPDRFPPEYGGGLFVALHGSAVRENAVGYSVVFIPIENGQPGRPRELVRGWLVGDDSWGRPVAPYVSRDGTLYVTDDKGGAIYRIRPAAGAMGRDG